MTVRTVNMGASCGIKTAVLRLVKENEKFREDPLRLDLVASFQEAVVNMLWSTTLKAIHLLRPQSIMLSGGVAANSRLPLLLNRRLRYATRDRTNLMSA